MSKTALITGITGQDGSYLAELLLSHGYRVVGMNRRSSGGNTSRIDHIRDRVELVSGDLADQGSIIRILEKYNPDEVYNLAGQSHVGLSWEQPVFTSDVTGLGCLRMLEGIRQVNKAIKYYQASSSELFGKVREVPQTEKTPFYPRSPYGCAKAFAHYATVNYRESFDMFACCGILMNHESPRRSVEFVTRKITTGAAMIKMGLQDKLMLGNLESKRDWGHARCYCRAMHLMLQQKSPDDYVISTGETHSVKEFCTAAFSALDMDWEKYVISDPKLYRPAEVDLLLGDSSKARKVLGWKPEITFEELAKEMAMADYHRILRLKGEAG